MKNFSDAERIKALGLKASRGDGGSFAELCEAMKPRLYAAAIGILGSETLALDAVAEAVCRAYGGIRKLRRPEYTATWFTRVLINCANDIRRRAGRELPSESLPEAGYQDDHSGLDFDELIAALPEELREIISLKYFSGFTLSEIAGILRLPPGTVKSRLNRALSLLRLEVLHE